MIRFLGTSGFSYPGWKGHFYPKGTKPAGMLAYYAERLSTVELNAPFYKLPPRASFEKWASEVGDDFSFAVKAPQRITHHKKLLGVEEELGAFFAALEGLGSKLGPSLFQLPPSFAKDTARLEAFLALLPRDRLVAIEFRHASWFEESTYALLRAHGVALVGGDTGDDDKNPPLVSTAKHAYLRLRQDAYTDEELARWAERMAGLS